MLSEDRYATRPGALHPNICTPHDPPPRASGTYIVRVQYIPCPCSASLLTQIGVFIRQAQYGEPSSLDHRQGQARNMRAGQQQAAEAIPFARCPKATWASTSSPSLAARGIKRAQPISTDLETRFRLLRDRGG